MTVLLDTTVLIDILRGFEPARVYLESLSEVPHCSELSRVEVLRGVRSSERTATEALLSSLDWVPVDRPTARRAGELGRAYRQSHPGLGTVDLVVAASALERGAELATSNARHFPMFAGLTPPYL